MTLEVEAVSAVKSTGSSQSSIAAKQSGIIYTNDDHTLTVGDTVNKGGIIAHIQTDSEGNQVEHNVNFTTNTLVNEDLVNTKVKDQRNLGGSMGVGTGKDGESINNVGIQAGHTGQDYKSITQGTIGKGAVVTGDAHTGKDSLANVNRDPFNTEIIIKDQQTAGLNVDANIDARVFTEAGRTQIIDQQKDIGKNAKKITAITATDALKAPAIIAAVTDNGNKNPDSQNKPTLDKVKDSLTQIDNNNRTGMSDDTATLVATEELIVTGDITNVAAEQDTYNQLASEIASGTDAQNANVYINPDLTESRDGELGTIVLGSANEATQQDIYLDRGALDRSDGVTVANGQLEPIVNAPSTINVLNEEIAHIGGMGEASASKMGDLGEIAYNVGKWANSGDIAEAKGNIDTTAINNANTAQEQQEILAANKERLESQQEAGDAFEDEAGYRCTGMGLNQKCSHPSDKYNPNGINRDTEFLNGAIKVTKQVAGGVAGAAVSVGKIGEPFLHPIETYEGLKQFANEEDKMLAIQLAVAYDLQTRADNYNMHASAGNTFGESLEASINTLDAAFIVASVAKAPSSLLSILPKIKAGARVTYDGAVYVMKNGKIEVSRTTNITSETRSTASGHEPDNTLYSDRPSGQQEYVPIPSNFDQIILEHNTQVGIKGKNSTIAGAHLQEAFLESLDRLGARQVGPKVSDSRFPGLYEYRYQIPVLDRAGNVTNNFKRTQTKTVYDPSVISNSQVVSMSNRAANKAMDAYRSNPDNRVQTVNVDGYIFKVTFDNRTGMPNNAFLTLPNR